MSRPHRNDGDSPSYFGLYPAIVTDLVDAAKLGRILVRFPWLGTKGDRDVRSWATLCSPYADDDQGLQILPEVDSQVVVGFEAGHLRRPYIVGSTWNGTTSLPHDADAANNLRQLRTRSGSRLVFDDTAGAESITVSTASGHEILLDNASQEISITHANGCTIQLTAGGTIEIRANSALNVNAPTVNVTSPMSTFSGTVVCQLLQTQMVMSPAYTPGAGNVW